MRKVIWIDLTGFSFWIRKYDGFPAHQIVAAGKRGEKIMIKLLNPATQRTFGVDSVNLVRWEAGSKPEGPFDQTALTVIEKIKEEVAKSAPH